MPRNNPLTTSNSSLIQWQSCAKATFWLASACWIASGTSAWAQTTSAAPAVNPEASATEVEAKPEPETPAKTVDPYLEAKEHFSTGVKLYDAGNFDAALTEFTQAYKQMAGHPGQAIMLRNMGKAQEALFFYDDAIHSYRGYLKLAPDAKDAEQVTNNIELLERFLGQIKISLKVRGGELPTQWEVWVSGRKLVENSLELRLTPGTHEIEVKAPGYSTGKAQLSITSGKQEEISVELEVLADEYRGLPQPYFWTAAGVATATAITGGVFGALAQRESKSVKNRIEQGPPESLSVSEADQNKIDNLSLAADICFATAGVFAVGTVVLGILTDWDATGEQSDTLEVESQTAWQRVEIDAAPLPSGAWLTVGGTF